MATLRQWLTDSGFNFDTGTIVYQKGDGWEPSKDGIYIDKEHPILDHEFNDGYGGPQCPAIFAKQGNCIWFPGQYDGSTWLEKVCIDSEYYKDHPIPYPGG